MENAGLKGGKMKTMGPDITKSALLIVDMQNDFMHPDGIISQRAKEDPAWKLDWDFHASIIPNVKELRNAFREAGRPVAYIVHVLKPDYSDAAFPYWRAPSLRESQFIVEGTWGAQIIDELTPRKGDHLVIKKGYNGFSNTPLDTILSNLDVNTCVVTGTITSGCVSSTIRGGIDNNYRMIIINDATVGTPKELHEAEQKKWLDL